MLVKNDHEISLASMAFAQIKLFDILKLKESQDELQEDLIPRSFREIQFYFDLLLDPDKGILALQQLYEFSLNQGFSTKEQYFTNLLELAKLSITNPQMKELQIEDEESQNLPPEEITNMCLRLFYKMISFPRIYGNRSEIKIHHITELFNLLPNPIVFKILGKLIFFNIEFANHLIELGIDKIAQSVSEENAPLFIYLLGSFAIYEQLNEPMIQYYDAFIIQNSISSNDTIRKYCYDAISLLCQNSAEMLSYISNHELFKTIFTILPETKSTMIKFIELVSVLLEHESTTFLNSNPNCVLYKVIIESFNEEYSLANRITPIVFQLIKFGFLQDLINEQIDAAAFHFSFAPLPFPQKESAMKMSFLFFLSVSKERKFQYLEEGLIEIIRESIDSQDSETELHKIAFCAYQNLVELSNENPQNEQLQQLVESILEVLSTDEYDEIQSSVLRNSIYNTMHLI